MSLTPWLRIGSNEIYLESLPFLLERSRLLLPLFKRILIESCISSVEVSESEQKTFHTKFLSQNSIANEDELAQWLEKNNLTEEQATQNILEALSLEKYKDLHFSSRVDQVFLESKDLRDRVVYSMLRVSSRSIAQELFLLLQDGDSTFTELCEQHSVGSEKETGGLIGPIELARLHPQVSEMLRISTPGQLWQPFELEGFWVLLRLDKKFPSQLDQPMIKRIRNELFNDWLQSECDRLMRSYKDSVSSQEAKG